jgi:FkbM family methyltransferase
VIVDIGANTGIYALVAKTVNPNASVYAFEPHSFYYPKLEKNAHLNNFDIHAYQRAISNYDGIIELGDYSGAESVITTEAVKLDTFIEKNSIKKIDLMKIDVETHEPQVLEGFMHYLPRFKPAMIIEILDDVVAKKVSDAVSGLGYLYFNIDEKGSVRQTSEIGKSDYYNYLLCHPSMAAEIGLTKNVEK